MCCCRLGGAQRPLGVGRALQSAVRRLRPGTGWYGGAAWIFHVRFVYGPPCALRARASSSEMPLSRQKNVDENRGVFEITSGATFHFFAQLFVDVVILDLPCIFQ